jgi:thiol-disulfide isomerase/thioredoxin
MVQPFVEPMAMPPVVLADVAGREVRVADLRGQTVFLNFWATWCVPCREEMPALEALHRTYGPRGFVVLAVNYKESGPSVRRFVRDLGLSMPIAIDPDGSASQALRVRGLPVTFLIDRNGWLVWKAIGAREWNGPDGKGYLDRLLRR